MRVVVRGGGDLATGVIHKLYQCGFEVIILECAQPTAIRRYVSFSDAVYHKQCTVEEITCEYVSCIEDVPHVLEKHHIPLLVDALGNSIKQLQPDVVVDAIIAKKNVGTYKDMANIVIALGPGFEAGKDVHAVIETKRGHRLGRIYYKGCAAENTGIPGKINGYGKERVIHAPADGMMKACASIGEVVQQGQCIAKLDHVEVYATITGVLRGILPDGFQVWKGLKMADIDPREDQVDNCTTISDKARCIAGGVLEAILHLQHKQ